MAFRQSTICKGHWQTMRMPVPLRGVASAPFRAFGIRPSRMNPNLCTVCESMFTRVMKTRQISIDATILFADLRGYTSLSRSHSSDTVSALLDAFYDECAEAIWDHDGLLNKTMGDAVMAIFNFPIRRDDHAAQAVRTARAIHQRCAARRESIGGALRGDETIRVGIGIELGTSQLWRIRPDASGSDGDRDGREHGVAGAVRGHRQRNSRDPGRLRGRAIRNERGLGSGLPSEGF